MENPAHLHRIAVYRCGLRVAGYEMTNAGLPEQVTQVCEI
jgi:hypothetical protein